LSVDLPAGERFRLKERPETLRGQMETTFGCLDEFSGADDLHRVLDQLRGTGAIECPENLEIIVYPSAVDDSDVALITVFSTAGPHAHVVAASEEIRKLATRELWEGEDLGALTVEIIESVISLANGAIAFVRELEARNIGRMISAPAHCPRCGAENQLRAEYRYDVLGLTPNGEPVLTERKELTDIFCLACGEEVDDVKGPDLVLAGGPGAGAPDGA